MRTTDAMREVLARPIAKVPALRGRQVTILFYEASTRTRVSFEVAAKNLSADVVNIAAACIVGVEGRVAGRHRPDGRGARGAHARHAPLGLRRAVPRRRGVRRVRAQRWRRLARPPDPGAAGPVHDARAARRVRWPVARSSSWATSCTRASLARTSGPSPPPARTCGCAARPRWCAGFEAWAGARRGGRAAVHGDDGRRRGAAGRRRRHGAADPARADGRRPAALDARVRGPVRADPRPPGARASPAPS